MEGMNGAMSEAYADYGGGHGGTAQEVARNRRCSGRMLGGLHVLTSKTSS